jgi:hypothetical protein
MFELEMHLFKNTSLYILAMKASNLIDGNRKKKGNRELSPTSSPLYSLSLAIPMV